MFLLKEMRQPDRDRVQVFFVTQIEPAEDNVVFKVELVDLEIDIVEGIFRDLPRPADANAQTNRAALDVVRWRVTHHKGAGINKGF